MEARVLDLVVLLSMQELGLGISDEVHEVTDTALGDHVRHSVSHLNSSGGGSAESSSAVGAVTEHGEEVDDGIGAPRDHSGVAGHLDEAPDGSWLVFLGLLQADEERVNDEGERNHRDTPEDPAGAVLARALAGVSKGDHQNGGHSEVCATRGCLLRGKAHHEHDLDEQEGDGQEPVYVAVRVVEGETSGLVPVLVGVADVVVDRTGRIVAEARGVRLGEGIEDAEVMIPAPSVM